MTDLKLKRQTIEEVAKELGEAIYHGKIISDDYLEIFNTKDALRMRKNNPYIECVEDINPYPIDIVLLMEVNTDILELCEAERIILYMDQTINKATDKKLKVIENNMKNHYIRQHRQAVRNFQEKTGIKFDYEKMAKYTKSIKIINDFIINKVKTADLK
jgi:hypothetical protein